MVLDAIAIGLTEYEKELKKGNGATTDHGSF
jgi:hypothetical protein